MTFGNGTVRATSAGMAVGLAVALTAAGCGRFLPGKPSQGSTTTTTTTTAPTPTPVITTPAGTGAPVTGPARLVKRQVPKLGSVVTDADGWVLYRYDRDSPSPKVENCNGDCAKVWRPVLTIGIPVTEGVDPTLLDTVVRPDGTMQVTLNGWPMYRYTGDRKPLDVKGQGVNGAWWAIAPDGSRSLGVPATTARAVPLAPDPTTTPTGGYGY